MINSIGNNAVGKMYRPHRFINSEKRGFSIFSKYKSNFGGNQEVIIDLALQYDINSSSEIIMIDILSNINIPIIVSKEEFEVNKNGKVVSIGDKRYIENVRNIVKPDKYNISKSGYESKIINEDRKLKLELYIYSKEEKEIDKMKVVFYPTVVDDKEYIAIHYEGRTPLEINNQRDIRII